MARREQMMETGSELGVSELERRRNLVARARRLAEEGEGAPSAGPQPAPGRLSGLKVRCPFCHESVDLPEGISWSNIRCHGCSENFSLLSDRDPDALPGNGRLGPFELLEFLGAGAFGTVWKARDSRLDRVVALKVARHQGLNAQETDLFFREARAAAQLDHPNIVGIHEVGRDGETIFLVSPLVAGTALSAWLADHRLTYDAAADFCRQIATALAHSHALGVVHRDLKPANILVTESPPSTCTGMSPRHHRSPIRPHVTDFGLAKRSAQEITITLAGQVMGTPAYMSPEQAAGNSHTADERSDIYSLGTILFELLTDELPYRGEPQRIVEQLLTVDVPAPRQLNRHIPRDLETICLKCLRKNPAHRYATAEQLAQDLECYLDGKPISARPVTTIERAVRWIGRNRMATAFATFVLLVAIVSPYIAVRQARLKAREVKARVAALEAGEKTRQLAYAFGLNNVQGAIRESNHPRARAVLRELLGEGADPESLGFPWLYWWKASHAGLLRSWRSPERPTTLTFSNDGAWLFLQGKQGVGRWDFRTESWAEVTIPGLVGIRALACSPDRQFLAVAGRFEDPRDREIRIFQLPEMTATRSLGGHALDVYALIFSPVGSELYSASCDGTIRVWNPLDGACQRILEVPGKCAHSLAITRDGANLYSGGGSNTPGSEGHAGDLVHWDLRTGKIVAHRSDFPLVVTQLALQPDEHGLVAAGTSGAPRLVDVQSLIDLKELEATGSAIHAVACDAEHIVAAGANGNVSVWNAATGKIKATYHGHTDVVHAMALRPGMPEVYSAASDFFVMGWALNPETLPSDLSAGRVHATTSVSESGEPIAIDTHGERLTIGDRRAVISIDLTKPGAVTRHTDANRILAIDGERHRYVTYDPLGASEIPPHAVAEPSDARLDDEKPQVALPDRKTDAIDFRRLLLVSGSETHRLVNPTGDFVSRAALSPRGDLVAVGIGRAGNSHELPVPIILYDTQTGARVRQLNGHCRVISAMCFSRDGRYLAAASGDRLVAIWDVSTGKLAHRFDSLANQSMAFLRDLEISADGEHLAGCDWIGGLFTWRLATGELQSQKHPGVQSMDLAISPRACTIAMASNQPSAGAGPSAEISLWDGKTLARLTTFGIPGERIVGVIFSESGEDLIAILASGKILVWRAARLDEVKRQLDRVIDLRTTPASHSPRDHET